MYEAEFCEAIDRSARFDLVTPELKPMEGRLLVGDDATGLGQIVQDRIGVLDEDEIVAQCLSLHLKLRPVFAEYFNCPVYFTIGYVNFDGRYMFKQTEIALQNMLKEGLQGKEVNLHAWLTLPTMEVIDFSLGTTYAKVNGVKEMMGRALANHPDEFMGDFSYHPMLVGEDYLIKTGAMAIELVL